MFTMISRKQSNTPKKIISCFIVLTFFVSMILPPSLMPNAYAQSLGLLGLPLPGTLVTMSPVFTPVHVSGLTIYPDAPLKFDFIINTGTDNVKGDELEKESKKLINYFLASLTVPEDELWVNLSPYEQNRIIANGLGNTEMGRDMLAQDYLLKQLSASLMYPEDEVGSEFWKRVHKKAQEKFGTTEIPTNTFNKIWIVPQKADVYVTSPEDSAHATTSVFVMDSYLKVMLEEDYLALETNKNSSNHGVGNVEEQDLNIISQESLQIVREVLIPEIEREVNEGKNFANLRQIFHSMILASWYKDNLKESLVGQVYANQNRTIGIDLKDKDIKNKIYDQYVEAFKKGVYNYIKEDYDEATKEVIPRKYFSGGILGSNQHRKARLSREWFEEEVGFNHVTARVEGDLLGASRAMLAEQIVAELKTGEYLGLLDHPMFADVEIGDYHTETLDDAIRIMVTLADEAAPFSAKVIRDALSRSLDAYNEERSTLSGYQPSIILNAFDILLGVALSEKKSQDSRIGSSQLDASPEGFPGSFSEQVRRIILKGNQTVRFIHEASLQHKNQAMMGDEIPIMVAGEHVADYEFQVTDELRVAYSKANFGGQFEVEGYFTSRDAGAKTLSITEKGSGDTLVFSMESNTSKDSIMYIEIINQAMLAGEKLPGDKFDPIFYFGQYAPEINDKISRGDPTMKLELGGKGAGLYAMSSDEIQAAFKEFIDGVSDDWLNDNGIDVALFKEMRSNDRIKLNVPPGYTISTEQTQRWDENGKQFPPGLEDEMEVALQRLEETTGKRLGAEDGNPLSIAIRSGAKQSLPGMMDTVLNLGLTDKAVEAWAAQGNARLAWDSYRRFIEGYGTTVMGVKEDDDHSKKIGFKYLLKEVTGDRNANQLEAEDYKRLVDLYKKEIARQGKGEIPQDARVQYKNGVEAVMRSTFNERANQLREEKGYSKEETVSAVNVVAMVYGNRNDQSGTGVSFTRSKVTGERKFNATWYFNAQGEDVVAGRTKEEFDYEIMKNREPEVAISLFMIGQFLENFYRDVQDMEFTYEYDEGTKVTTTYMLQTRNLARSAMSEVRTAIEMIEEDLISKEEAVNRINPDGLATLLASRFDPEDKKKAIEEGRLLSMTGLNAAPGAGVGGIVFDADSAVEEDALGNDVALLRVETSPEDIGGMRVSNAIGTEEGARGSHAALVANIIGIPAVVGDSSMKINFAEQTVTFTKDDGTKETLKKGDVISIDGTGENGHGQIFKGAIKTTDSFVATAQNIEGLPRVERVIKVLRRWIDETEDAERRGEYVRRIQEYEAFVQTTREKMTGDEKLTDEEWAFYRQYKKLLVIARGIRDENDGIVVGGNAEEPLDIHQAVLNGAETIGLARTEHMHSGRGRELKFQKVIMAENEADRRAALKQTEAYGQADFEQMFLFATKDVPEEEVADKAMLGTGIEGIPFYIRLIDPPLHEFLPRSKEKKAELAQALGIKIEDVQKRLDDIKDKDSMFGSRGVRLSILFPEIIENQTNAIFAAAKHVRETGQTVYPEIFVPLVGNAKEFVTVAERVHEVAAEHGFVRGEDYILGTMIEITAGADNINEIAPIVDFISLGTNDLIQSLLKLSRDDGKKWLEIALLTGVLEDNPFVTLPDVAGAVIETTIAAARAANPNVTLKMSGKFKCSMCGEQGLDTKSIRKFSAPIGLDIVSGGARRIPGATITVSQESQKGHKGVKPKPRAEREPVMVVEDVPEISGLEEFQAQIAAAVGYVEGADTADDESEFGRQVNALANLDIYATYLDEELQRDADFNKVLSWAKVHKRMNVRVFTRSDESLSENPPKEDGLGMITTDELLLNKRIRRLVQTYLLLEDENDRAPVLKKIANAVKKELNINIGRPSEEKPNLNIVLPNIALEDIFKYETEDEFDDALEALLIHPSLETREQIDERIKEYDESNPGFGERGSRVLFTDAGSLYTTLAQAFTAFAAEAEYEYLNISLPFIINGKEVSVLRKGFVDKEGEVRVLSLDDAIKGALKESSKTIPVGIGANIETPSALYEAVAIAEQLQGTKGSGPITFETKKLTEGLWAAMEEDIKKKILQKYREKGIWPDDPYKIALPAVKRLISEAIAAIRAMYPNQVINLMINPRDTKLMAFAHQLGVDNVLVRPRHAEIATIAAAKAAVTAPESNKAMMGMDDNEAWEWEEHARLSALEKVEDYRAVLEAQGPRLISLRKEIGAWSDAAIAEVSHIAGTNVGLALGHLQANAADAILERIILQNEAGYLGEISWDLSVSENGDDFTLTFIDNGVGFDEHAIRGFMQHRVTGGKKKELQYVAGAVLKAPTIVGSNANALKIVHDRFKSAGKVTGFAIDSVDVGGVRRKKTHNDVDRTKMTFDPEFDTRFFIEYGMPELNREGQGTTLLFDINKKEKSVRSARTSIARSTWSEKAMLAFTLREGSEDEVVATLGQIAGLNEADTISLVPAIVEAYLRSDSSLRTGTIAPVLLGLDAQAAEVAIQSLNRAMMGGGFDEDDAAMEELARDIALGQMDTYGPILMAKKERLVAVRQSVWNFAAGATRELAEIPGASRIVDEVIAHLFPNALDAILGRIVEQDESGYLGEINWRVETSSNGDLTIIIDDNGVGFDDFARRGFMESQVTGGTKKTLAVLTAKLFDEPTFIGSLAQAAMFDIKGGLERGGRHLAFSLDSMDVSGQRHRKNQTQISPDLLPGGIVVDYKIPYVIPVEARSEQGTTLVFDTNREVHEERVERVLIAKGTWSEKAMLSEALHKGDEDAVEAALDQIAGLNSPDALEFVPDIVSAYARFDFAFRAGMVAIALQNLGADAAPRIREAAENLTDADSTVLEELDGIAQALEGTISDRGLNSEQDAASQAMLAASEVIGKMEVVILPAELLGYDTDTREIVKAIVAATHIATGEKVADIFSNIDTIGKNRLVMKRLKIDEMTPNIRLRGQAFISSGRLLRAKAKTLSKSDNTREVTLPTGMVNIAKSTEQVIKGMIAASVTPEQDFDVIESMRDLTLPEYMRGTDFSNDARAIVTAIVAIASETKNVPLGDFYQAIADVPLPDGLKRSTSHDGQLIIKAIAASVSVNKAMVSTAIRGEETHTVERMENVKDHVELVVRLQDKNEEIIKVKRISDGNFRITEGLEFGKTLDEGQNDVQYGITLVKSGDSLEIKITNPKQDPSEGDITSVGIQYTNKAMVTNIPGGIDFNPNNFTLNQQGQNVRFNLPDIRPSFENQKIDGILPVIINITPITNFPVLIFGDAGSPTEDTWQQLTRSYNRYSLHEDKLH